MESFLLIWNLEFNNNISYRIEYWITLQIFSGLVTQRHVAFDKLALCIFVKKKNEWK